MKLTANLEETNNDKNHQFQSITNVKIINNFEQEQALTSFNDVWKDKSNFFSLVGKCMYTRCW